MVGRGLETGKVMTLLQEENAVWGRWLEGGASMSIRSESSGLAKSKGKGKGEGEDKKGKDKGKGKSKGTEDVNCEPSPTRDGQSSKKKSQKKSKEISAKSDKMNRNPKAGTGGDWKKGIKETKGVKTTKRQSNRLRVR